MSTRNINRHLHKGITLENAKRTQGGNDGHPVAKRVYQPSQREQAHERLMQAARKLLEE